MKGPILQAFRDKGVIYLRLTAWLATQCRSHQSPGKFPANREFYREFCDFEGWEPILQQETAVKQPLLKDSLSKLTGNCFRETGNVSLVSGKSNGRSRRLPRRRSASASRMDVAG